MSTDTTTGEGTTLEPLKRLSRDLKAMGSGTGGGPPLSTEEARLLVDYYYLFQEDRKRAANQVRALAEAQEPNEVIRWVQDVSALVERRLVAVFEAYSSVSLAGRWAKSIYGIGPVITTGLLAHLDVTKAPTVGHLWRFAGLDPTSSWDKGKKRPWNASLKTLCWKIGESFVKVSNREDDVYGHLYARRKQQEIERNETGLFAEQAALMLQRKKFDRDTTAKMCYQVGKLPPAHLHARAKRWTVKLFLAHFHHVAYVEHFGTPPPKPYVLSVLGHGHEIAIPNWPMQ